MSPPSSARIVLPMATPSIKRALFGKVYRTRLADHHDLDLPGILQVTLDLAGDLLGEGVRLDVIDRVRRDDHADFASRLNRKHLFDSRELSCDLFDRGEPLHVRLEGLTPRPWP